MSSSEQETISTFRSADLPKVCIPADFESSMESSGSDNEGDFIFKVPTTPTDLTPATSTPTELGSTLSQVALSSQTSEESDNTAPATPVHTKKQRGHKLNTGRFRKGEGVKRKSTFTPSTTKRLPLHTSTPKSKTLLQQVKFPQPNKRLSIMVQKDGAQSFRDLYVPHGSQIIDIDILSTVFSLLRCTEAHCTGNLNLYQYAFRDGLQYLLLKCSRCHLVLAEFPTSCPVGMKPNEAVNDPQMLCRKKSEVNVRALLAAHCTSMSWSDFLLTCNLLDIQNTWHRMSKSLLAQLVLSTDKICQQSMSMTAKEVRAKAESSNIPGCKVCAVSFDGSWHRRGHFSNQGFAGAIEVKTGKVLDYVLYERVCNKCIRWTEERKKENPEEYSEYWEKHSSECPANFSGTSQAMESSAAIEIWGRSVDKHSLAYTTYVGDGDSSSFKRLEQNNPYKGMEVIRKEECLGHTQKRLKKHLKKKTTTKTMPSKPIPASKVERIAHLYALVIGKNRGRTPLDIQNALYTLMNHLFEEHDRCPHSKESWCYFQKGLAISAENTSHPPPILRQPYLNKDEYSRLEDVFKKFASIEMCSALTMGLTQNCNESLHSVVWHNAPKTKRVGQKSLQAAAAIAVCTFNEGSMMLAAILSDQHVQCSRITLEHLASMDKERNRCKLKAVMATQKRRRRVLKSQFIAAESSRRRREKDTTTYKSGGFGTELSSVAMKELPSTSVNPDDSETVCEECEQHDCPTGGKRANDDWLGCEFCLRWFHCGCVNTSLKYVGDDPYICRKCDFEFESCVEAL